MEPVSVLLVDDHNLVRAGIRALVQEIPNIQIVGETYNGRDALQLIDLHHPNLVLMDISLPDMNGLEVARQAKLKYPDVKIIFLSMFANEEYVLQAISIGASGYLLKNADTAELEMAFRAAIDGNAYLSPAISKRVIEGYKQRIYREPDSAAPYENGARLHDIPPKQLEILRLIAEGLTTKEIAYKLSISPKTVEAHRSQMMRELNIHDLAGLVRYAIRIGLVSAE